MLKFKEFSKELILFITLPVLFFCIGYQSKSLFGLNIDFYFIFSQLSFFIILAFLIINFIIPSLYKHNYQILSLLIISCSLPGILIAIIQLDLIPTRWLAYGKFDINDANDYFNNASELLINKTFYSAKGRIVYPVYYASLLKLFNLNVFLIQILLSALCSIVIFITSFSLIKRYNYFASLLFLYLCVDFIHENLGGNCTELIGFLFGLISFQFFLKLISDDVLKYNYYLLFYFALFFAFIFRPGPPLIFLSFFFGFLLYFRTEKFFDLKKVFSFLGIFLGIAMFSSFLKNFYSPLSPFTFINAIDSWYATIELGNYIRQDSFHQIPNQMWNLIYEQHPHLLNLKGTLFTEEKIKIFLEKILSQPISFIYGSLFLIKQFFVMPFSYWDPHHNTTSFMFVDFLYIRLVLILFFLVGIVSSLIIYIYEKNRLSLFIFLIGASIVLSQPFLYGGESRTHASTIPFLFLTIYYGCYNFIYYLKMLLRKKKMSDINTHKTYLRNIKDFKFFNTNIIILLVCLFPFFTFSFYNKIDVNTKDDKVCLENQNKKTIIFNSQSGFNLTKNLNEDHIGRNYGVDHFLELFVNHLVFLNSFGVTIEISWIDGKDFIERDKFPLLTKLFRLSTPRLHELDNKLLNRYTDLFKVFSYGGGFFINPINIINAKDEGVVILPSNQIKKGVNILQVCK